MTTYTDIRAALTARLQTLAASPAVAWENIPFTRTVGTPYLQPWLLMAEPDQASIGDFGLNRQSGVYQVSIYYPINTGSGLALQLADNICTLFKRGTVLAYNGQSVEILKAWIAPMDTEPDWLHIPISITFKAFTSN